MLVVGKRFAVVAILGRAAAFGMALWGQGTGGDGLGPIRFASDSRAPRVSLATPKGVLREAGSAFAFPGLR